MDSRLAAVDAIEDNKGVDPEVGEVEVDVHGVEADEEVDEGLFLGGGDVGEESVGNCLTRGEWCANGKAQLEGLRVDIANVDTTLVCEENVVTFTGGVDADVVLGIGRMRQEGLDDEVVERAYGRFDLGEKKSKFCAEVRGKKTDLNRLASAFLNPWPCLVPGFVESKEASLAAAFDKLVRLCDELGVEDPAGELSLWSDGAGLWIPRDLSDLHRRVKEFCRDLSIGIDGGGALKVVSQEELRVVFTNG